MTGKERRDKMFGKEMQKAWESLCNEYLRAFCEKHDLEYNPSDWVGVGAGKDGIGTVANPGGGDYWIDMDMIRYDIDHAVPVEKFLEYQDYIARIRDIELSYDLLYNPKREEGRLVHINYPSFCKGAPRPYSDEQLKKMEEEMDYLTRKRNEFVGRLEGIMDSLKGND